MNDWKDENAQAVRNLYAKPDDQSHVEETQEPQKALHEVMAHEALGLSEQLRPHKALNEVKSHEALRLFEKLRPL